VGRVVVVVAVVVKRGLKVCFPVVRDFDPAP
jgi:hypothetical protein